MMVILLILEQAYPCWLCDLEVTTSTTFSQFSNQNPKLRLRASAGYWCQVAVIAQLRFGFIST